FLSCSSSQWRERPNLASLETLLWDVSQCNPQWTAGCSPLQRTGTVLVVSAEAKKPKKKFLRLLTDWGNFSLVQLEFSNFDRPPASVSGGDEWRKSSCVDMYEHKTFTFLSIIVQRTRQVTYFAVPGDGEEPERIFSRYGVWTSCRVHH
uniref:Uncharacterized protein n=1 Tax=Cyanoderma ruficeps TaxID=181631 RepID=A0A8C3QTB0_9PASS